MPKTLIRYGQVLMLAALVSAAGGHWLALQSVAWGTMLVDYGRASGFCEAISRTFDGRHPCALCKSIQKNSAAEKKGDAQAAAARLDYLIQPAGGLVPPSPRFWLYAASSARVEGRAHPPALQPPRVISI